MSGAALSAATGSAAALAGLLPALGPASLFGALLVCRCAAALMMLPGFGANQVPPSLRAGFALILALLIGPPLWPALRGALPSPSPLPLIAAVLGEIAAGALLGLLARLCLLALPVAGQIISLMTGMSSVLVSDAELGAQSAVIGRLLQVALPALLLASPLYRLPLAALAESYHALPLGGLMDAGSAAQALARGADRLLEGAVALAAPFVVIGLLWQAALALLARLVPHLQLYFAALPGQILGGLTLLALLTGALLRHGMGGMAQALGGLLP